VVNPAVVAEVLETYPDVVEAVVVALGSPSEPVLGALIESARPLEEGAVRRHSARHLPRGRARESSARPARCPRLPSGKPDRLQCLAMLERAAAAELLRAAERAAKRAGAYVFPAVPRQECTTGSTSLA